MALVNEQFWRDRIAAGKAASPCWSGEPWLDFEHGIVMRSAITRAWPRRLTLRGRRPLILDIGCGDGQWSRWMAETFNVDVIGTDALVYPGVHQNLPHTLDGTVPIHEPSRYFVRCDAEELRAHPRLRHAHPALAVFMNSLTCASGWKDAVRQASELAPRVLAFDNFLTPTPAFLKNLPHRRPITQPELRSAFFMAGMEVEKVIVADYFHRKLFLALPWVPKPITAYVSAALDLLAARVLPARHGRHLAYLFKRQGR